MPPSAAATAPSLAAISSVSFVGAPFRLSATAWASISMCPSSSAAVSMSMSRYLAGPWAPQAWNMYCIATRISPSTPPIACWSSTAKRGSGLPHLTSY